MSGTRTLNEVKLKIHSSADKWELLSVLLQVNEAQKKHILAVPRIGFLLSVRE